MVAVRKSRHKWSHAVEAAPTFLGGSPPSERVPVSLSMSPGGKSVRRKAADLHVRHGENVRFRIGRGLDGRWSVRPAAADFNSQSGATWITERCCQ